MPKHVSIVRKRIESIKASPENKKLYRPVKEDDPEVVGLSESIRQHGIQEPLVVTKDNYILSGHRRHVAARLAGLHTVPCRVKPFQRDTDLDRFVKLLREHNRQRVKSRDELLREAAVDVDQEAAYLNLSEYRTRESKKGLRGDVIEIQGTKRRADISEAKAAMAAAVKNLVFDHEDFWPLSVRQVHYMLLNDAPLKNSNDPESTYQNDLNSYKNLCDLLARMRLVGIISWEALSDETRTVEKWYVHRNVQPYLREQMDRFLLTYWRDLMQSQPHQLEIVGEKNTLAGTIHPVAEKFCAPFTLGRGYCSLDPRHQMAERYWASGKDKLIVLMMGDLDPDGEDICHSFTRSMRDDFSITDVMGVKVALTAEQVAEYELQPKLKAKKTSSRYKAFADKHGENVWEIEAIPPQTLQDILERAIETVIDIDAYNDEVEQEREDARALHVRRKVVLDLLKEH